MSLETRLKSLEDRVALQSLRVYVRYFLDYLRTPSGWKVTRFGEAALLPLPKSLTEIHAR